MGMSNDEVILEHYRKQAEEHQLDPSSTMLDETTRQLEIDAVVSCLSAIMTPADAVDVLEVGCGNGYLLSIIRERFPGSQLTGVEYSPEMLALARRRAIPECTLHLGDVRALELPTGSCDVVVSERCLINLLVEEEQEKALEEIHRILRPGGHLVLIEAFTDGAAALNRARSELGLAENSVPYHNLWFDKQRFRSFIESKFEDVTAAGSTALPPGNFLSTHYFVSRVLYPAVTKREILYNTEFVKFFRGLPPQGDLSPIQLFFLRKPPRPSSER